MRPTPTTFLETRNYLLQGLTSLEQSAARLYWRPGDRVEIAWWREAPTPAHLQSAYLRREEYTLFQASDTVPWIVFFVVFFILILFDNFVLHRKQGTIGVGKALAYTCFWVFCSFCWSVYVWQHRGWEDCLDWATAYLLEWMLSIDCLFFFHIIFKLFGTPDHLKHRPLFYGIVGAIVFRMIFFYIEEMMMHSFYWTHIVFGIFLIYTGIKSAMIDDQPSDPRNNVVFKFLSKHIRFVNGYDNDGRFFVKVKLDPITGEPIMPTPAKIMRLGENGPVTIDDSDRQSERAPGQHPDSQDEAAQERIHIYASDQWYNSPRDGGGHPRNAAKYQWRATVLVLVVICLELTDLIFAVDSVSAIVAEVPDLFLAYTASVFAMLGLRAMFFVTDELIRLFILLKYGIASILVLIGVKLILSEWVVVHPLVMLSVLVGIMLLCIVGSLMINCYNRHFKASVCISRH